MIGNVLLTFQALSGREAQFTWFIGVSHAAPLKDYGIGAGFLADKNAGRLTNMEDFLLRISSGEGESVLIY
jgi:hypothetical protein